MNRNLFTLIVLVVSVSALVSCGSSDKHAWAVPKDAAFVFHLNTPALTSKLSWNEIKATNWFKEAYAEAEDSLVQKLMDNPENSGINTQADLVFFIKRHGRSGYMAFTGTVKDAAAFEAFNKKVNKRVTAAKDGDLNVLKDDNGVVTWKDNRFIYVINAPFMAVPNRFSDFDESSNAGGSNLPADSLTAIAKELYALKGDNNLLEDKRFASLVKETGDVHMWLSSEHALGGVMSSALSMLKVSTLLEGNVTAATLNFDNGKITIDSKSYYNKELGKIYEKYKMKNVDADVVNRIPSQNVVGIFTMNYPPEGLQEFLKVLGIDGWVNSALAEVNYSMEEFVTANKGDVLFTVTDFEIKKETITYPGFDGGEDFTTTVTKPDMKMLFAASINDKAAFDKLVNTVKEKMGDITHGAGTPEISYALNNNWFAAGNSKEQVDKFLAGGNNNLPIAGKIAGHPMVMYVDINKILQTVPADSASHEQLVLEESRKMWQDFFVTGGELEGGAMKAHMEINLVDKNANSLKQLNQYIDRVVPRKNADNAF